MPPGRGAEKSIHSSSSAIYGVMHFCDTEIMNNGHFNTSGYNVLIMYSQLSVIGELRRQRTTGRLLLLLLCVRRGWARSSPPPQEGSPR